MNILFYCSEYPPIVAGGIGSVTKIVAENLVSRGHRVIVVGYYPNYLIGETKENINGVEVYRLNLGYRKGKVQNFLCRILYHLRLLSFIIQKEVTYLENFIQEKIISEKIDILELTDFYAFNGSSHKRLKFKKFTIPTVLRIHGSMSFIYGLSGKERSWAKINDTNHFKRCDYISAVSKFSLDYINNNFKLDSIDYKNRNVIYNPIEDRFLKYAEKGCDQKRILFVGKLVETKGCFSLLKAFENISNKYPGWKLVMVGRGDVEEAKKYISPIVAERTEFLGYLNRKKIQEQIDICSFACIPSYFENFSMVAIEIMGRKKALIYTERTSGKEVIKNGENGFVVDPENIASISEKIELLINDTDLRERMSTEAYKTIRDNFTSSIIVEDLISFYKSIV